MRREFADFVLQLEKMESQPGFVAALDQSGGSTPGALRDYGIPQGAWSTDEEMFALVHRMRARVIKSPAFDGARILGAILFEDTVDREIEGRPTAGYLWEVKAVVPFLKVDRGLLPQSRGVQRMKPMPDLAALLEKARAKGIFGTKMRSVIREADRAGIRDVVAQQFELARAIFAARLVPIIEPEVDIHCPQKALAEEMLEAELGDALAALEPGELVILKLTLPEQDDLYADFVHHPRVVRVLALSGGYSRDEANYRLRANRGMVASYSRALLAGLSASQSDAEFDRALDDAIQSIYEASRK